MHISCWARKTLTVYLDDELTSRQRQKFEAHLRGCPRCQRELQQLRQVNQLLRSMPTRERSEQYWLQTLQQLRGKLQPLPAIARSPLSVRFAGLVESLPSTLLPLMLLGAALINALAILGFEEEAVIFFSSYILPLVLG
jgi:anti-sigma factor RsiW